MKVNPSIFVVSEYFDNKWQLQTMIEISFISRGVKNFYTIITRETGIYTSSSIGQSYSTWVMSVEIQHLENFASSHEYIFCFTF